MISQGFRIWTTWEWEYWRYNGGAFGLARKWKDGNVCTDEGLNYLLNILHQDFQGTLNGEAGYVMLLF